jgi:hypothetical protein
MRSSTRCSTEFVVATSRPLRAADGWVTIDDRSTVEACVASLDADEPLAQRPHVLPIRSRRASSVFVAEKA